MIAFFEAFTKQNTKLIVRLDILQKRLDQYEVELAQLTHRWNLISGTADTQELDQQAFWMDVLWNMYNEQELRSLAFSINVDYEGLEGASKFSKAEELYKYCKRHNIMDRLKARIRRERAHVFDD